MWSNGANRTDERGWRSSRIAVAAALFSIATLLSFTVTTSPASAGVSLSLSELQQERVPDGPKNFQASRAGDRSEALDAVAAHDPTARNETAGVVNDISLPVRPSDPIILGDSAKGELSIGLPLRAARTVTTEGADTAVVTSPRKGPRWSSRTDPTACSSTS